jgi:hypothetical protein
VLALVMERRTRRDLVLVFAPLSDLTMIGRISPSRDTIPGWNIGGEGHEPTLVCQLLTACCNVALTFAPALRQAHLDPSIPRQHARICVGPESVRYASRPPRLNQWLTFAQRLTTRMVGRVPIPCQRARTSRWYPPIMVHKGRTSAGWHIQYLYCRAI